MLKSVKNTREWTMDMPWGKLAMISWGRDTNPPVLMVHGYVDSAATFAPLIKELPEDYYYIAFDMPGHGKSNPFPAGLAVSQLNIIEVIRRIVESMKWEKFICIAHSMGAIISLFYNNVYPGRIAAMVLLDPGPALNFYYFVNHEHNAWYYYVYEQYYSNYHRYNSSKKKLYSYEDAVSLTAGNRKLTEEQAEIILSRSLEAKGEKYSAPEDTLHLHLEIEEGKSPMLRHQLSQNFPAAVLFLRRTYANDLNGKRADYAFKSYNFSMDPRMKYLSNIPVAEDTIRKVITSNVIPTLVLEASINDSVEPAKSFALNIIQNCMRSQNYYHKGVAGGHDFHITNPSAAATHVARFLSNNCNSKSLLCKI